MAAINDAKREATAGRVEPSGLLRIGAPVLFASAHIAPAIGDYMERYPQVEVKLIASDRQPDLIFDGLDLAIRVRELPDSSLKVRRLGELRVVVFNAPAYLARSGRPRHPDELAWHQCVVRVDDAGSEAWPFRIEGERRSIRVNGRFQLAGVKELSSLAAVGRLRRRLE